MKACPLASKQNDEQTSVTQSLSYYVNRLIQVTASSISALVTPVTANYEKWKHAHSSAKQHGEQTGATQPLSYYVNKLIQVTASSIAALVTPVIANCTNESMPTRQPNNMVNKLVPPGATQPVTK
jgi:hypothetical protein